ncbi:MAG: molecular chaperone DnaJ [Candidatus Marinimicrobia bacterium]|nr:molecular chaperone DnaJ [Candidatus Neomarinimicrobiota bacterium]|tara:strand:- start:6746 stop:7795 length:1050 start_codon:yes stop_codon:yes gene_type:complete
MRDYYDILGINKSSSDDEIKKAYRKIAIKYHPDKNPDNKSAEEKFKEAAEAYSVLSDSEKRQRYDQFGHAGVNGSAGGQGFSNMDVNDIFSAFGDIFGDSDNIFGSMFGNQGRSRRRKGGSDLKISIPLTLEEMYNGGSKTVKIKRFERIPGQSPQKCTVCGGSGQIKRVSQSFLGQVVNIVECSNCNGTGMIGGREKKSAEVTFDIPQGVSAEHYQVVESMGNQGVNESDDGNLIVYFQEKEHSLFMRNGSDIYLSISIGYHQAVLGTKVKVPTINGNVNLTIPKGIKSGQIVRVKGKGMPDPRRRINGDQFVKINIITSDDKSKDFILLMEKMKEILGEDINCSKFE